MQNGDKDVDQHPLSLLDSTLADPLRLCITHTYSDFSRPNLLGSRHSHSPPIDIPGNESRNPAHGFRPVNRVDEDLVLHLSKRVQVLEREIIHLKLHVQQVCGSHKRSPVLRMPLSRSSSF